MLEKFGIPEPCETQDKVRGKGTARTGLQGPTLNESYYFEKRILDNERLKIKL